MEKKPVLFEDKGLTLTLLKFTFISHLEVKMARFLIVYIFPLLFQVDLGKLIIS